MAKPNSKPVAKTAAEFITPLNVNGLTGRMVNAPSLTKKSRSILVIYDQHASLERWQPLIEELRRYGSVTMPDLPGFGGMRSFYRINRKPTIDSFAGYMAAFVKLRYKRKPVTVVGVGFGFVVATRMLQLYPDLHKKINLLVSIDGFAHREDMNLSSVGRWRRAVGSRIFSWRLPAIFFRNIFLHPWVIRLGGQQLSCGRFTCDISSLSGDERAAAVRSNIQLWRRNDVRTYMHTTRELMHLDNCSKTVPLNLWHITSKSDKTYDLFRTDQHLKVIFSKVTIAPSAIDNYEGVGILPLARPSQLLPPKVKSQLSKS